MRSNRHEYEPPEESKTPNELVAIFSRCANFPRDLESLKMLEQGLVKAGRATGVDLEIIVERCSELSEYCPTDFDLLQVAKEIAEAKRRDAESKRKLFAEWAAQYGPARPFVPDPQINKPATPRHIECWTAIKKRGLPKPVSQMSWVELAQIAREVGFEDFANAWEHCHDGCGAVQ